MKYLSLATVLAFGAVSVYAADFKMDPSKLPPAATQQDISFAKDIHPILDEHCVHCHGEKEAKHQLRLDTLEGVLKGAKDHKVVEPGDSAKSRLVYAVADINGKVYMPPKPHAPRPGANGETNTPPRRPMHMPKPLTSEQVSLLRAWIDQGAKP